MSASDKELYYIMTAAEDEEHTMDVQADTIMAGNPAKFIKRIPPRPECSAFNEDDETIQLGLDSCGDYSTIPSIL